MLKLEKFLSHLQIFYTDHKFLISVTLANSLTWWYVLKTPWRYLCKKSWRCLEDVLKTSWRCLADVFARRLKNVLKTPRRMAKTNILGKVNIFVLIKTSWRRLEDVSRRRGRKTSSRRLHQDECLLGQVPIWATSITYKEGHSRWNSRFQNRSFVDFSF